MPGVHYLASAYRSLDRVARDYAAILHELVGLTPRADEASLVVAHVDSFSVADVVARVPRGVYKIGYLVWEADRLAPEWVAGLSAVDEIWTPTEFCREVFARHHDNVRVVPHVVEARRPPRAAVRSFVRQRLRLRPDDVVFTGMSTAAAPRKNLRQLVRAFLLAMGEMPRARLVVKTWGQEADPEAAHGVTIWNERASGEAVTALLEESHVLVSPHHGEGWGLSLSDAMLLGKLVVATAYSGNLDFMHPGNAILVPAKVASAAPADPRDGMSVMRPEMQWAQLTDDALAEALLQAYRAVESGEAAALGERAKADMQRFSRAEVKALIAARLGAIGATPR